MNDVISVLEHGRQFFVQHTPAETLAHAIPAGILFLVAGIALSVLGAKLARFGVTSGFVALGAFAGLAFGRNHGFSPLLCVLIGAFFVGVIGFQTFRLWVGVGAALVFSVVAMTFFGAKEAHHISDFEESYVQHVDTGDFTLPTPEQQQAYLERSPEDWATSFWGYLTERDPGTARNAKALSVLSLLVGLTIGLIASKWALILSTSLVGTMCVVIGGATLLASSVQHAFDSLAGNPSLFGVVIGGFFVTSLALQALLAKEPKEESSD